MTPPRPSPDQEQGAILVLTALLAFGLLGLAGTVIDLGLVRQSQSAMQAATDAAALEGLRYRDSGTDLERRQRAQLAIARAFDDDLDLTNGDAIGFGAGPDLTLTDTLGNGRFGGVFAVGSEGDGDALFDPRPVTNEQNLQNGDLVAGTVDPFTPGFEFDDYTRTDFVSTPQSLAATAPAFLARLRRTPLSGPRANALDRQAEVSTSGPAIPLLWSRGGLVQGPIGTDGVTVRSTSIAEGKAALAVSSVPATATTPELLVPGPATVLPAFTLTSAALVTLTSGLLTVTLQGDGRLESGVDTLGNTTTEEAGPMRIGRVLVAAPPARLAPDGSYELITPITDPITTGTEIAVRVTGFRRVRLTVLGPNWTFELDTRSLLPTGATAFDAAALRELALSPELRERYLALSDPSTFPVLAPRLAR